jgi:type I restriction enzyme S subunit
MKMLTLGDFADTTSGSTPPRGKKEYWYPAEIPWVKTAEVAFNLITSAEEAISKTALAECSLTLLPPNTVLVAMYGQGKTRGQSAILDIPAAINQACFAILPNETWDPEFLHLWLIANYQNLRGLSEGRGGNQANLNGGLLNALKVPAPDKTIQRQIATRLKAQLAEVDKARQAAEAQLRDAHTLYAVVLKETFLSGDSETWPRIELGEVGDVVAGVTLGRKANGKAMRPIPYLRVANVKDGYLDLSGVSTIEATEAEIQRLLLQPGDILLTEGGDPDKLGRGTFWSGELKECIHQNHIFRVRFPSDSYLPEFIAAQIGSTYGKDYFFAHAKKTTGIATINQKVLKSFPVLSPPIEIQKIVMDALNSRLDEAGKIIQSATQQLSDINLLPQKILAQAFEM